MSEFVLDASVAMRWILSSCKSGDQEYAWRVLDELSGTEAIAPSIWGLEVGNVLLKAENSGLVQPLDSERFIEQLEALRIRFDTLTSRQALTRTFAIARSCKLSSYDAAYLELSVRTGLPISTLDKDVRKAARKLDVPVFLV